MWPALANNNVSGSDGCHFQVEALRARVRWPCSLFPLAINDGCVRSLVPGEKMQSRAFKQ